jgi:hypothetical protein
MNFCGYLPRAINADLRYYSQLHLFDISITEKLESLDYFLSSSSKKSIMDVAGKVNVFIWQLSATLHPSSSFSVCRSDCRLVHQLHFPKEVMSLVLAGFADPAIAVFPTLIQYFIAGPPIGLFVVVLILHFSCPLVVQFLDCTSKSFYHDAWLGLRRLWALYLRLWALRF